MNSARDVYKNIVKSIKYAKENSKLLEMKKSNNMSEAIKEFEKNLNKKVEGDINTNEYKKMENCYRAIYILLGSEKEMSEIHISDIKDNELYNEFNKKMVGLCKSVSYGSFFEWLFQSWEHAYCITETDVKKRIKIINFYTELITIVFSVIKGMEEPEFVERAKEIYDCSMKIYINMKRVIVLLKHDVITDNKLENGLEQKENLKIQAIELLEEYCKIVDNVEEFNEENMYVKNHYDEYTQLKLIENFFKVNKNRIDKEVYDKYVEKSKEQSRAYLLNQKILLSKKRVKLQHGR